LRPKNLIERKIAMNKQLAPEKGKEVGKENKDHKDKLEKEHAEKWHRDIIKDVKPEKDADVFKAFKDSKEQPDINPGIAPGGDPAQPQVAYSLHKFHGKEHPEKFQKDFEKVQKDKEFEAAMQAAQPQAAGQALHKFVEKLHFKDVLKELKIEKLEKFEKIEIKEIKEWDVAGPGQVGPGDPVEQRVAALEATVTQLLHFIPADLRPDLSTGALNTPETRRKGEQSGDKPAKEGNQPEKDKK
jgi:hypothetical protein